MSLLRIELVDPPRHFDEMTDLEPMLETKDGPEPGERAPDGTMVFETELTTVPGLRGKALKREKDGRYFVYIGWYGTSLEGRTRFRRLKVHLTEVPTFTTDATIRAAGTAKDGSPACATATILKAWNPDPKP